MKLFDNIGDKLMKCAFVLFILGVLGCVAGAIVLWYNEYTGLGFLVFFVGPLVVWLLAAVLFGFGKLIDNSEQIRFDNSELLKSSKNKPVLSIDKVQTNSTETTSNENKTTNSVNTASGTYAWESKETGQCENCGKPFAALYNCIVTDYNGSRHYFKLCKQCRDATKAIPNKYSQS